MKHGLPRTKERKEHRILHRLWMGALVVGMATVTALQGLPREAGIAEASAARGHRVVMYVYDDASFALKDRDAGLVDQVNYSFALIRDGEAHGDHWHGIRQMSAFLERHPQVDGVLSVGGWGADGFSQACATQEGQRKLADSILRLMDAHGFVGVDIDWEYPGSSAAGIASSDSDVEHWYALLGLLRQGLDERTASTGRKHLLSVAVGGGRQQLNNVSGSRLDKLVDQVVLMAYDLRGFDRVTGHHAGLYPDGGVEIAGSYGVGSLVNGGLSSQKLLLGIPAYGHMWRQVSGGDGLNQRAGTSGNKVLSFPELQALEEQGYTRYWDDVAQACWWYDGKNFVSGEDEMSLAAKVAYIRKKGLLGAAVWCWNNDPESTVVEAIQ